MSDLPAEFSCTVTNWEYIYDRCRDVADGAVAGKDVLIVDDIADTGRSLRTAADRVADRDPATVRTATLQLLDTSDNEPAFVGERLAEWTWVVYPWNFIEDMTELVAGAMADSEQTVHSIADIRSLLQSSHDLNPTALEIAQPDRLEEVMVEMVRREQAVAADDGWRLVD